MKVLQIWQTLLDRHEGLHVKKLCKNCKTFSGWNFFLFLFQTCMVTCNIKLQNFCKTFFLFHTLVRL